VSEGSKKAAYSSVEAPVDVPIFIDEDDVVAAKTLYALRQHRRFAAVAGDAKPWEVAEMRWVRNHEVPAAPLGVGDTIKDVRLVNRDGPRGHSL